MNQRINNLENSLNLFKHKTSGKVRFAEVDSFGVVHNIQYLYWLEAARTEYFSDLRLKFDPKTFIENMPLMVVHSEIDYFNAARFNEKYEILTRVSSVKNSSLTFENIITLSNGTLLVFASSVLVNLNPKDNKSQRISEDIRLLLKKFEGDNIKFLD
jgi:acyl-CoA thioester hydrolase